MPRVYKNSQGYVKVRVPSHPSADRAGFVSAHTLNAEKKIGRPLKQNEVVHHKNRDKADNRQSNLRVMDRSKHSSMHKKYD